MTKEEVLQKANDYCTEKAYTEETLTEEFKEKFADFFSRKHQDAQADDEAVIEDLKFNIDTAFSATSKGVTAKQKAFSDKESEYKRQIEELNKKISQKPKEVKHEIPQELKDKLDELEKFKDAQRKQEKYKTILDLAKKNIREDLHKSFENYASDFVVNLDETDEEQSKKLTARFQEIFKDSIGSIKPLAPKQTQRQVEEFLSSIPKIKVC